MHPEIARALVAQHHDDLLRDSESGRRGSSLVIIISAHRSA
jgi:hypothetical protein